MTKQFVTVPINKIWIDDDRRLCIQPQSSTFELIYRSAMGVQWNVEGRFLYSMKIERWTPADWYRQIAAAVESEYGCKLRLEWNTIWKNVDDQHKSAIKEIDKSLQLEF